MLKGGAGGIGDMINVFKKFDRNGDGQVFLIAN